MDTMCATPKDYETIMQKLQFSYWPCEAAVMNVKFSKTLKLIDEQLYEQPEAAVTCLLRYICVSE